MSIVQNRDNKSRPQYGVVVGWTPANRTQEIEVQRAPDDGTGAPDTANAEFRARLAADTNVFVDFLSLDNVLRHWRVRHVALGLTAGAYTDWIRAKAVEIPQLPSIGGGTGGGNIAMGSPGITRPSTTSAGRAGYVFAGTMAIGPDANPAGNATINCYHVRSSANAEDVIVAGRGDLKRGGASYFGVIGRFHGKIDLNGNASSADHAVIHSGFTSDATVVFDNSGAAGTLTNFYGIRVTQPQRNTADSITNAYGLKIEDFNRAWMTTAYSLYTGAGIVQLGDTTSAGPVRIGATNTATVRTALDIVGNFGAITLAITDTDATNKSGLLVIRHYTNAEEAVTVFGGSSTNTINQISFGGGHPNFNAAQELRFYTAANQTTLTGTQRVTISDTLVTIAHPLTVTGLLTASAGYPNLNLNKSTAGSVGLKLTRSSGSEWGIYHDSATGDLVIEINSVGQARWDGVAYKPFTAAGLTLGKTDLPWSQGFIANSGYGSLPTGISYSLIAGYAAGADPGQTEQAANFDLIVTTSQTRNRIGATSYARMQAGAGTQSHLWAHEGYLEATAAGTVSNARSFHAVAALLVGAGTFTEWRAYSVATPVINAGAITTAYGLYVESLGSAGTRYSIFTNGGDNVGLFGGAGLGSGSGVMTVGNATTNPSTNPTAGGILYANAGAGTWRGSGGTVTAFGPAGPHCARCGYDFWRIAAHNNQWGASLYECGWCGAVYKRGPASVIERLSDEQRREILEAA